MARIARDPRDFAALIDAGDAANAMGDPEAAIGFYKRADGISPNNARAKAGLARTLVLQGKPTEAIPLFAGAELGGAAVDVTSDRGLAYDLVGDPITAQRYYQAALARGDEDEVRRRLGISLAITGDAAGSNAMLMPLLRKQDKPAWRAHAFALAIAGKTKEAVDTVNAILPAVLAQSVTPYLRYMPRLTRAQQAAAGNLGKFPRASEIGRDDPAIAAYAPTTTARVASADARLIPRGRQLGAGNRSGGRTDVEAANVAPLSSSERRARDRAARLARAEAAQTARVAPPDPTPTIGRESSGELPALATARPMAPAATMAAAPASASIPAPSAAIQSLATREMAPPASEPSATVAARTVVAARPAGPAVVRTGSLTLPSMVPSSTPRPVSATSSASSQGVQSDPSMQIAQGKQAAQSTAALVPRVVLPQSAPVGSERRSFDLAALDGSARPANVSAPVAPASSTQGTTPTPTPSPSSAVSLEQMFADLGSPSRAPAPIAGAVDVRAIEPMVPAPIPEPAKVEQAVSQPVRSPARAEAPKALARKDEVARTAEQDALAAGKKKPVASKDGKLAEAKSATTKLANTKVADAKPADPKKTDAKKADPKKADAKKPPSQPSRVWVQIGVGRDKAAIGYDWRKLSKENPALFKGLQAYTSDMGRTNRILAGPFETQKAAADMLAKLKKADVGNAFVWTSSAGQAVDPLTTK